VTSDDGEGLIVGAMTVPSGKSRIPIVGQAGLGANGFFRGYCQYCGYPVPKLLMDCDCLLPGSNSNRGAVRVMEEAGSAFNQMGDDIVGSEC
jgi:hypothetical protein